MTDPKSNPSCEPPFQYIFKRKHSKRCLALNMMGDEEWSTPWGVLAMVFRDGMGNSNPPRYTWLAAHCNYPLCDAEILIRVDDILRHLPKG
jgi:hypothetical protein